MRKILGFMAVLSLAAFLGACSDGVVKDNGKEAPVVEPNAGGVETGANGVQAPVVAPESGAGQEKPADFEWSENFAACTERSAATGGPVFAFFTGSDWCIWCKRLDKEVLSQKAFREYAAGTFVMFKADFPNEKQQLDFVKNQNEKLSEQYGIEGFPMVLILDSKGNELARTGYERGGAEAYVKHLKSIMKDIAK